MELIILVAVIAAVWYFNKSRKSYTMRDYNAMTDEQFIGVLNRMSKEQVSRLFHRANDLMLTNYGLDERKHDLLWECWGVRMGLK